ncbi:LysR family transcriptional regulator [Variovorax paradoxus]|jgi:DNA-binding transcriptional LysR family regulator|uniref:HTH-type transcriptional regulator DmlR n=1 Tax=Variovorax paradoxus TaxID=34073 RepID=A0A0H2M824_VARPD|nr:LysR family transcriptional regulator [Variovorax paradoxus]KLN58463.1 HTH-type transcriptional regulator DmlR [Variovorax paradoxus]
MTKARRLEDLWSHIHCLGVLANTGSFTAAARRLQISKASVSQRIAELEKAAGVVLVRRTTRSVNLTDAGMHLVDQTADAYLRIEESFSTVLDLSGTPRGVLSVTVPVALGRQVIAPLIPAFLKRYPDVRIQLELSDHLASLATDGFDLAIRHVAEVPDTHVASVICETRSVLVATREYLRKHGTPKSPVDLTGHNCLHYLRRTGVTTWSFESREGERRVDVPVRGSFTANNSEVLREAAAGSLGIALLPDFSAAPALQEGTLVEVLGGWHVVGGFAERLYAVRPYTPHVPRAVSSFVSFLRDALSPSDAPEGLPFSSKRSPGSANAQRKRR